MEHYKKLVVVPFDKPTEKPENIETKQPEEEHVIRSSNKKSELQSFKRRRNARIENILKIILPLAKINAYNEKGEIRSGDAYIDSSDIAQLILYAVTPGKTLIGESDFINLLIEADIDPYLIPNERIKSKMSSTPKHKFDADRIATVTSTISDIQPNVASKSYKRGLEDTDDVEPKRKKQLVNWTIPTSDDED